MPPFSKTTYERSRSVFDSTLKKLEAGTVYPFWTELQGRLNAWSNVDYGYQPAERRVLGLMEEHQEFVHATDQALRCDALGDMSICLIQLCTSHRLDAGVLIESDEHPEPTTAAASDWIGRLAYIELKLLHGIRGSRDELGLENREEVRFGVALAATGLFRWLQRTTERDATAHPYRFRGSMETVYADLVGSIAGEVMAREKRLLPKKVSDQG